MRNPVTTEEETHREPDERVEDAAHQEAPPYRVVDQTHGRGDALEAKFQSPLGNASRLRPPAQDDDGDQEVRQEGRGGPVLPVPQRWSEKSVIEDPAEKDEQDHADRG